MNPEIEAIDARIKEKSVFCETLLEQMRRVIVGQEEMLERLLIGLLCDGHILLEGVPGLAKTLSVSTLASVIDAEFARIQFTPDLLPADVIGTTIYTQKTGEFTVKKGPVFTNILLADEINRAPAKVQSALLEAMQERQVTIGDSTMKLPDPFLVLATQNPVEQEGTYPLPEAQVDRFLLKLVVTYPSRDEELDIIDRIATGKPPSADSVVSPAEIIEARKVTTEVYTDPKIKSYVVDLVAATRDPRAANIRDMDGMIRYGASPRASIFLVQAARAHAFLRRRGYVTPEDIRAIGMDVLRHRIILSYEAEAEEISSEDMVNRIFDAVAIP